jgi:hypothetical protein
MTDLADMRALGFKSVADFQAAWNLGTRLKIDGTLGPKTTEAVRISTVRRHGGHPDISQNFSASEFSCKCGGTLPGCRKTLLMRDLLMSLEILRDEFKLTNISILSGYRCPRHNKAVGGAEFSEHQYGAACDPVFSRTLTLAQVRSLDKFSGIGSKRGLPHRVTHVDRRDVTGEHNRTHGTVTKPTIWYYPGS